MATKESTTIPDKIRLKLAKTYFITVAVTLTLILPSKNGNLLLKVLFCSKQFNESRIKHNAKYYQSFYKKNLNLDKSKVTKIFTYQFFYHCGCCCPRDL